MRLQPAGRVSCGLETRIEKEQWLGRTYFVRFALRVLWGTLAVADAGEDCAEAKREQLVDRSRSRSKTHDSPRALRKKASL